MVGWRQDSCGYHSDDGNIFNNAGSSHMSSKNGHYGDGDIVGCGMSKKFQVIYFTRNGAIEATVSEFNKQHQLHPTMTFVRRTRSYYNEVADPTVR